MITTKETAPYPLAREKIGLLPSSIDFMLLGTCNLRCPFCFGPQHEIRAMGTETTLQVIRKLAENGVERIVFTGGEPTLIKDLPDILGTAKKGHGLTTVLSTNGLLLSSNEKLLEQIAPYLDWIALPLDGDTPDANATMRVGFTPNAGKVHFDAVLGLIPRIRNEYPTLKIKLGTVVAKPNIDHIVGIPNTLASQNAIPDTWKLYQVSPSEYGKINYPQLEIPEEEFEEVFKEAKGRATEIGIKNVLKYTNSERPGKYMFINPRGEVLIVNPTDNDYYPIGNILKSLEEVRNKWSFYVDQKRLTSNFDKTYPQDL